MLAIGMRSLIRDAYYPGVEREFARHYRRRYGALEYFGVRGDEPDILHQLHARCRLRGHALAGRRRRRRCPVYLSDEQRDLIALAMGADRAWDALQAAAREMKLGMPAWFDRSMFFSEIASRRRLLRAFMIADDRYQRHRTADARRAMSEAAAEIFRSMSNGVMVLEQVRTDRALLADPTHR